MLPPGSGVRSAFDLVEGTGLGVEDLKRVGGKERQEERERKRQDL